MVTKKKTTKKEYIVLAQEWEESERGWGIRPDGFTLHLTEENHKQYIKEFWDKQPKDYVPAEYTRESGKPFLVKIDAKTFKKLKKAKNGMWGEGNRCTFDKVLNSDILKIVNE